MNIRNIELETDYPTLCEWWKGHEALPVPIAFLPLGFMAVNGEEQIAACFLYLDVTGKCSMVEYLTTNPLYSLDRAMLAAYKELLFHVEQFSQKAGCRAIISMVAPGTGEERILSKLGYSTSTGVPHRMYGKRLITP